jgi:tetratricopeptide (TPR) repeat protein
MSISRGAGHVIVMAMLTLATGACATDTDRTAPADPPVQVIQTVSAALTDAKLPVQERARLLVKRALAHETLGERNDALSDFSDAIAANALETEEQATALYDRGVTLDELGRTDAAVADYSSAIALEPTFAAAFNNRGNALRRLGRLAEARRDYEASISAGNPNPEYSRYGLGQIAEALDQPSAAREFYRSALATNPQFALAEARLVAMDSGPQTPIARKKAIRHKVTALPRTTDAGPTLKPTISDVASQASPYVQLGAYRTTAEANEAWDRAHQGAGELLSGLTPMIVGINLRGKGRYYRLRLVQPSPASAGRLCQELRTKGIPCVPLRD